MCQYIIFMRTYLSMLICIGSLFITKQTPWNLSRGMLADQPNINLDINLITQSLNIRYVNTITNNTITATKRAHNVRRLPTPILIMPQYLTYGVLLISILLLKFKYKTNALY